MRSGTLIFVFLLAATPALSQTSPAHKIRYGHYVLPALGGATAGFSATAIAAAIYSGPSHCDGTDAECIDLSVLYYVGIAYLVSIPTGILGTTLVGHDKLRIATITLVGQAATVGGLFYLLDGPAKTSDFVNTMAGLYLLGTPLISALYAYAIDRAYVRRQYRPSVRPVVGPGPGGPTFGFSVRF